MKIKFYSKSSFIDLIQKIDASITEHQLSNLSLFTLEQLHEIPLTDGLSLEQLHEILNSSPKHSNTSYDKLVDARILLDDIILELDSDFQNIYSDLDDLCTLPFEDSGSDLGLHPVITEFAEEHYMQISDISLTAPTTVSCDHLPPNSEEKS